MPSKSYYVTTPIYYVNDAPHIGHAYTTVAGDVLTRWHRQRGESVLYLTGTDEHGTKVQRTASENDTDPQEWVDRLVEKEWRPVLETLDVANDDFIRTTEARHRLGVQHFWTVLKDNGHLYEGAYEGPYCVGCEEFKFPGDLVAGSGEFAEQQVCAVHGRPVETLSEPNWFFRLSEFTEPLIKYYEDNPHTIAPVSAYNEVLSFIKGGLTDMSMSRSSVSWGVPLPWDDKQVVYVWFDALLNYITAIGYGQGERGEELFGRTWPADVHLVGKDILRFHAVYWPAMLMAAGLPLPGKVFAHGWLLVGGEKMSKSKLTGIAPSQIIDDFGSDAFRYYFLRAIRFGSDGSFSWEDMRDRYTAELANGLGNLVSRATSMVGRYFDGVLPESGPCTNAELRLQDALTRAVADADAAMLRLDFSEAVAAVRSFVELLNGYVTTQEPWQLAKSEAERVRLGTVLYTIVEGLRAVAVLYNAVMPKASAQIWRCVGAEESIGPLSDQPIGEASDWGRLPAGAKVTKCPPLFPRLEEPTES
ncbi:MAG: methionine--tRNA ligase [Candidatus Nanopelagicales bacterium]|nr:methionine--tRNA ligase [Candidatus Nanopelagicales bacterium]